MDDPAKQRLPLVEPLSRRERAILGLLAEDLSDQEIAERLVLAYTTIKWYNQQIFNKLGVNNRQQAVRQAQMLGLLTASPTLPPVRKGHFPPQSTPFVGRERELADVDALLADPDVRLITLLAPGGMGKTRLALEAARRQVEAERYRDGVFFVSLAPLNAAADILIAVAEALDYHFFGHERTPTQQLLDFLRGRSLLLVLDNFEHLLEGGALVADVLHSTPQVQVLATSRERLSLSLETVYTLGGLAFPAHERDDAFSSDALELFRQRARRALSSFELRAADRAALARICHLTGGMPLGLELAAGWVDVLTPEQIAAELQRGLGILETEMRDIPERQRSIRATFDRTWERLTPEEQHVFMRLSVFRGGFTIDAARAVADADARTLRKLANKALIEAAGDARHAVHELLRQYAESKLAASAHEMDATADRHAAYYADFLRRQLSRMKTAELVPALDEVEAELDNVLTAWDRLSQGGEAAKLRPAALALFLYLDYRGRFQQGVDLLTRTAAALRAAPPRADTLVVLGHVLARLAWFNVAVGLPERAKALADEGLALLRTRDCPEETIEALKTMARIGTYLNAPELSSSAAHEALAIARALDDPWQISHVLYWVGQSSRILGAYDDALRAGEEQLHIAEALGDPWSIAGASGMLLGTVYRQLENYPAAHAGYERSLALFESIGQHWIIAVTCGALGDVALAMGDVALAKRCYHRRLTIFSENNHQTWETVRTLFGVTRLLAALGEHEFALEILAFYLQHPAILKIHRDEAELLMPELRAKVPPEVYAAALERGAARHLDSTVKELIAALR